MTETGLFGDNLKKERIKRGMTAKEVADELGISASYLSNLENNNRKNPSPEVIVDLCDFFNLDSDYVLSRFGFTEQDIDSIIQRMTRNQEALTSIETVKQIFSLTEKDIQNALNLSNGDLVKIKNKTFEVTKVKTVINNLQKLKEELLESSDVPKIHNMKLDHSLYLDFFKTYSDAMSTWKQITRLTGNELQNINKLDLLLKYKIDFYWKDKKLSEEDINKIYKVLDALLDE